MLAFMADLMEAVADLLLSAAQEIVLPVFGRAEAQPKLKSPGEWVTTADRDAEAMLGPALAALVPGSVVVGEEAASANPGLLSCLRGADDVWLLDPVDGTGNFAAGRQPFAVLAAREPTTRRSAPVSGTSRSTGARFRGTTRPACCLSPKPAVPRSD